MTRKILTQKTLGKLIILAAAAIFAFTALTAVGGRLLAKPGPHTDDVNIVITKGASAQKIATQLEASGAIHNADVFYWAARLTRLAPTLKAGEYRFPAGISTRDILNRIALGKTQNRTITFIEGWTNAQIIAHLEANEALDGDAAPTEKPLQEGLLYPDTYHFTLGEQRSKIILKLQNRAEAELKAAWAARGDNLPLTTPEELLTLASIVERETQITAEMPTVAGVYINRLNKDMRLQADPTVIYGVMQAGTWDGNLTRAHLRDESNPYNTYVHTGLPPTPIANPSAAAMQAVASPEAHDYLFFVATGNGGHNFARTYKEHKQNVAKYLIERRAQRARE